MSFDLVQELQDKIIELNDLINEAQELGADAAKTERDYKILLRVECLKLREEGMAIGMIDKTCYGIESVAEARYKRDCAAALYKSNQEAINSIKLQIRILDSQIQREWGAYNGN